jgi:hypothetical protein
MQSGAAAFDLAMPATPICHTHIETECMRCIATHPTQPTHSRLESFAAWYTFGLTSIVHLQMTMIKQEKYTLTYTKGLRISVDTSNNFSDVLVCRQLKL